MGWSLPNKPAETTRRHLHRFTQLNQTRVQTQTDVRRHRATLLRHSRSQVSGQHALWLQNGVTDASPSNGSPAAKNSKCPWSIEAMKMEVDLFFFFLSISVDPKQRRCWPLQRMFSGFICTPTCFLTIGKFNRLLISWIHWLRELMSSLTWFFLHLKLM